MLKRPKPFYMYFTQEKKEDYDKFRDYLIENEIPFENSQSEEGDWQVFLPHIEPELYRTIHTSFDWNLK